MIGKAMGAVGMVCKRQPKEIELCYGKREHPATPLPSPKCHVQKDPCKDVIPTSPGVHIKKRMPLKNNHRAEEMALCVNIKGAKGTNIGHYYTCTECGFECSTKAACIAHAHREHTDELIGPCEYCGSFYAHSVDTMRHHVNHCAGSTMGSDDSDD